MKMIRNYLSWSQFSTLQISEQQFIDRYLKGLPFVSNKYVELGKKLAERLKTGIKSEDEELEKIVSKLPFTEQDIREKEYKVNFDNRITLLSIFDVWNSEDFILREIKTGQKENMTAWRDQVLFYSLVVYLKFNQLPQVWLDYVPTIEENNKLRFLGEVKTFKIDMTIKDVLLFGVKVKEAWNKIQQLTASYYKKQKLDDVFND